MFLPFLAAKDLAEPQWDLTVWWTGLSFDRELAGSVSRLCAAPSSRRFNPWTLLTATFSTGVRLDSTHALGPGLRSREIGDIPWTALTQTNIRNKYCSNSLGEKSPS